MPFGREGGACYNRSVKRSKTKTKKTIKLPPFVAAAAPWINLIYLVPAAGVWIWEQFWHVGKGEPFSSLLFLKGLVLLAGASVVFHLCARTFKGFSFLGMLPLIWLAASKCQWQICGLQNTGGWLWVVLFLGMGLLPLALKDAKKIFFAIVPIWGGLSWLAPFSFLLPLSYLTVNSRRLKRPEWVRWGGVGSAIFFFALFQQWKGVSFNWADLYELMIPQKFLAFFLVGWLGGVAFPPKGPYRHLVFPLFWAVAGCLFVPIGTAQGSVPLLQWALIFYAGFGWESFRRDVMDQSWHGRLLWLALGIGFLGGVL